MPNAAARSASDRELADWVTRETGIAVSPWQIERWRQAGLLQPADHQYPGRGSSAVYDEAARKQAGELARLSRQFHSHDTIARMLFVRRLYVREDALRRSFARVLDRVDTWIGPADSIEDLDRIDTQAQKYAAASRQTKSGRALRRRLRHSDPLADVASVYYTLFHMFKKGAPPSAHGFDELVSAAGLNGFWEDSYDGMGPIAPNGRAELELFFRQATFAELRRLLASATLEDLAESRDLLTVMLPFLQKFATAAACLPNVSSAFGLSHYMHLNITEHVVADLIPVGLVLLPAARSQSGRQSIDDMIRSGEHFREVAEWTRSDPGKMHELLAGNSAIRHPGESEPPSFDHVAKPFPTHPSA